MDPDKALADLRLWAASMLNESDQSKSETPEDHEVAELFNSLDQWLSNAGFLPKDWE